MLNYAVMYQKSVIIGGYSHDEQAGVWSLSMGVFSFAEGH